MGTIKEAIFNFMLIEIHLGNQNIGMQLESCSKYSGHLKKMFQLDMRLF